MARDTRKGKRGKKDRCKYYKRIPNTNEHEVEATGVFYSEDIAPMTTNVQRIGAKIKDKRSEVSVLTNDNVSNLEVDDFVLYGGEWFRVDKIIADDDSIGKEKSKRPTFETTITLVK